MRLGSLLGGLVGCSFGCAIALAAIGCSGGSDLEADDTRADASTSSTIDDDGGDPAVIQVDVDGGITSIDVAPFLLVPPFSPSIENYAVRCDEGTNAVTLTVSDTNGESTVGLDLLEDHAIVVQGKYWIRCLPHDFPPLSVTTHPSFGTPTSGWYLIGNTVAGSNQSGFAMVLDTNGTPVWYRRAGAVQDVESFALDTLSYMPSATAPFGFDSTATFDVVDLDSTTTTLSTGDGSPPDGHELRFLENGDHLLLTYPIESGVDLTGLKNYGANETVADCQVQEVDSTGKLVWSWLASQHIDAVKESLEPQVYPVNGQTVTDVFHCNSIDVDASGNLLVSSRHTNAVYYIDRASGSVEWKLGGAAYNKDGATHIAIVDDDETTFSMQHDARFQANGDISLFDDHGQMPAPGVARGVEYAIDHDANTAKVVWEFRGTTQSQYMGSFRRYADGENVIGWGGAGPDLRALTEVNAAGQDVLDVSLGSGNVSYRAVKVPLGQLDVGVLRNTVIDL